MIEVTLYRTDPARNMARFYHLDIQRDLFGNWCLVREWGRIGKAGRCQINGYQGQEQAVEAFTKWRFLKERRGYSDKY